MILGTDAPMLLGTNAAMILGTNVPMQWYWEQKMPILYVYDTGNKLIIYNTGNVLATYTSWSLLIQKYLKSLSMADIINYAFKTINYWWYVYVSLKGAFNQTQPNILKT